MVDDILKFLNGVWIQKVQATVRENDHKDERNFWFKLNSLDSQYGFSACLHGAGGPQVGEVTLLGGVTPLSI